MIMRSFMLLSFFFVFYNTFPSMWACQQCSYIFRANDFQDSRINDNQMLKYSAKMVGGASFLIQATPVSLMFSLYLAKHYPDR